ncbi:hypothetical protein SAMN05421741_12321 [Paenimyroides ummariense]|uniref:Uncharacterized protein n=1 Tax=Paenimyroides ummariense TaxID=913024 RepID=A0A1I5EWZ3_9FLAO|nr:hypothetical protein [Paenimyroides ummariense]SFO16042.1 hypothetical protein SAMN05421741_12321 [Paenimyroides ummariense]
MNLKNILVLTASIVSLSVNAQIETGVYFSNDRKFVDIIEDLGNPLEGNPVMIVKTFVPKHGSYIWYLNESKAKNTALLDDIPKDLHSGIYLEDHGGIVLVMTFKDFAKGLSQPRYLINYCEIADADNNGFPEFYLTYFEESDGLDVKPLKVIVYTKNNSKTFSKSKITAWLPFQPEDKYREEMDDNFRLLPKAIKMRAENILKEAKEGIN